MESLSDIPTCYSKNKASTVCVSLTCNRPCPYQCSFSECTCRFQHGDCQSMNWNSMFRLITDYPSKLSTEMVEYIARFQKIYTNIKDKIDKQLQLFKRTYQKSIFSDSLQKIKTTIKQKKLSTLRSKDFRLFLTSLERQTEQRYQQLNRISLKQLKQIDNSILQLFSRIQIIYKSKLTQKAHNKTIQRPNSSLQKSIQTKQSERSLILHKRSSSLLNNPFPNKSQILTKNQQCQSFFQKKISVQDKIFLCKPAKIDLKYPKSINSKIIQQSSLINSFIGRKINKLKLLYRASQNDFSIKKFYEQTQKYYLKSQNISKGCLILVKTQYGKVLGGYTQLMWITNKTNLQMQQSQDEAQNPQRLKIKKYRQDVKGSTFLFSSDFKQKYQLVTPSKAIYCGIKSIGFGQDLRIRENCNKYRQSICNYPRDFKSNLGQVNKKQKCLQIIGSRYSRNFKISQWQAFGVQFQEHNN